MHATTLAPPRAAAIALLLILVIDATAFAQIGEISSGRAELGDRKQIAWDLARADYLAWLWHEAYVTLSYRSRPGAAEDASRKLGTMTTYLDCYVDTTLVWKDTVFFIRCPRLTGFSLTEGLLAYTSQDHAYPINLFQGTNDFFLLIRDQIGEISSDRMRELIRLLFHLNRPDPKSGLTWLDVEVGAVVHLGNNRGKSIVEVTYRDDLNILWKAEFVVLTSGVAVSVIEGRLERVDR